MSLSLTLIGEHGNELDQETISRLRRQRSGKRTTLGMPFGCESAWMQSTRLRFTPKTGDRLKLKMEKQ